MAAQSLSSIHSSYAYTTSSSSTSIGSQKAAGSFLEEIKDRIQDIIARVNQGMQTSSSALEVLNCPITMDVPKDPVVTNCGHLFDRSAIKDLKTCALCSGPIENLTPIYALKEAFKKEEGKSPVPNFSTFSEFNYSRAFQYIKLAKSFCDDRDYDEALKAYQHSFTYIRQSEVYEEIPYIYERLFDFEKATLARLYLTLYQLQEGKTWQAKETLKKCNSLKDDLLHEVQEISKVIPRNLVADLDSSFYPSISLRLWKNPHLYNPPGYSQALDKFLSQKCSIWPGKIRAETHIVVPLFSSIAKNDYSSPVAFSLKTLMEVEISFQEKERIRLHGDGLARLDQSSFFNQTFRFAVMTKEFIPGTANRYYKDQKELLPPGYLPPPTALHVLNALIWDFRLNRQAQLKRQAGVNDGQMTNCDDRSDSRGIFSVGSFDQNSLSIQFSPEPKRLHIGLCGWMEFLPD